MVQQAQFSVKLLRKRVKTVQITFIVAMDANQGIGYQNQLPWHLPADLQHFKQLTMGKPILMGRKTQASIGRPLPGRMNVVITRNKDYKAPGCQIFTSIGTALSAFAAQREIMVIGGASLFARLLPRVRRMYITRIAATFPADVYFPVWDANAWQRITEEKHSADEHNPYDYTFFTYERLGTLSSTSQS